MILNIPIITTNVSDSLRIIQNKHGVVTQKNVNSIYNAMKNAIINGISQKEEFDYKEYNQEINEKLEKLKADDTAERNKLLEKYEVETWLDDAQEFAMTAVRGVNGEIKSRVSVTHWWHYSLRVRVRGSRH
jgi:hypothetical protein